MLNDASGFRRIYLATGYTDLRRGMEGLASIIKFNFQLDPYHEYSNAIVHAFQRFRAPFSGKIVHIFPEQSAVI